jgi:peptide/nickel transport system substrate-binding protein
MNRARLVVVVLVIVTLLLGACTTPTPEAIEEEPPAVEATPEEAEEVEPEPTEPAPEGPQGTIEVGMSIDPKTLDPRSTGGDLAWTEIAHVLDRLYEYDVQEGTWIPKLAESWERVDDVTWQFKLREGVTFHNGEPFNAESVKYTIESTLDPEKGYVNASWIRDIEEVEIVDDYTVNLITKTPFRSFLVNLAWVYLLPPEAAEEMGDQFATNPIGTGPYKFVRYVANEELVLEANEDYWGEPPQAETLIFRALPEDSTRLAALETGEVMAIPNVSPDSIDQLVSHEDLEVVVADPATRIVHLAFVWGRPPFDNLKLRQAFNYAVDRQALVDTILNGLGAVADRHLFHSSSIGFNDDLQSYAYDPERAKELLAEAGYPDGITVKFGCPHGRYLRDKMICEAIVGQFAEVGITSEFEASEWGSFWDKAVTAKEYDLYLLSWGGNPDPIQQLSWWFDSRNSPTGYTNERVDELLQESQAVFSEEEAAAVYGEVQEVLWEDLPWVSLYFQPKIYAQNEGLENMVLQETIPLMDFRQASVVE